MSESAAAFLRRLLAPAPLRPPGARDEEAFLALCIRCGRCIEVCTYRALRPAGFRAGSGAGAPYVEPRTGPCWLCMKCPPVCPTGALQPVRDPRAVAMGRARIDRDRCYAFQGILCQTCLDACPIQADAIHQDGLLRPVVTDRCVGCGLCEQRCPVPESAIRVVPRSARGART